MKNSRWLLLVLLVFTVGLHSADDKKDKDKKPTPKPVQPAASTGTNLIPTDGTFEKAGELTSNPWGGVKNGVLSVLGRPSTVLNKKGKVERPNFSPSIGAGDLNGDGLPDLVVADPQCFFWFYKNVGTKQDPQFKRGEVIPIYLGQAKGWVGTPPVNRIHLVDVEDDGDFDLLAGDSYGRIWLIRNEGGKGSPKFVETRGYEDSMTQKYEVNINPQKDYWCNYTAPFYFDWNGDEKKDLIMGDGTYAANQVYLMLNKGNNSHPRFDTPEILARGLGREQLIPQVIDWNGDGKPDLLVEERQGKLWIYENDSAAYPEPPYSFKDPKGVTVGGLSSGDNAFATPCLADMNGDGLFDLLVGKSNLSGGKPHLTIAMALNKGTLKEPKFDALQELKGTEVYPKCILQQDFTVVNPPPGNRFWVLGIATGDPKFKEAENYGFFPDFAGHSGKAALLFKFVEHNQELFSNVPIVAVEEDSYVISCTNLLKGIPLKEEQGYLFSMSVMGNGFSNVRVHLTTAQSTGGDPDRIIFDDTIAITSDWSVTNKPFRVRSGIQGAVGNSQLFFTVKGTGTFYLDDVSIIQK